MIRATNLTMRRRSSTSMNSPVIGDMTFRFSRARFTAASIAENVAHDFECPRQVFSRGASISDRVANPLLVDFNRPTRVDEALDSELDEQIPEMEGIEEIGVEVDNRRCERAEIRGHAP